jgi:hypothetical protein
MKEYYCKLGFIDFIIKSVYLDLILFVIFNLKLLDKYKAIINRFYIIIIYNKDKKIKILINKKNSLKACIII